MPLSIRRLHQALAWLLTLHTVHTVPTTLASSGADATASNSSILELRQSGLDRRIHWEGDRQVYSPQGPFAPNQNHPFATQTSVCDRDRGATGWICQLYPVPDPPNNNPAELYVAPTAWRPVEQDPHVLGHCADGSICVDVGHMMPPPDARYPQQGIGPFAACLDRSHIIQIVFMLNYRQKVAATNVGTNADLQKQRKRLAGETLDVIASSGADVNREGDMEFIDIEVEKKIAPGESRPDGFQTLASKICKVDAGKPVRSCRIDKMPAGADRINVKGKTYNGGGVSGVNANIISSNPLMYLDD